MTMTDPQTAPLPADGTNAQDGTTPEPTARKQHAKPSFDLVEVGDDLPVIARKSSGTFGAVTRTTRFKSDLEALKAAPGKWFQLADYGATTTAKRTARFLEESLKPTHTVQKADGTSEDVGGELLELVAAGGSYEFVGQRSDTDDTRSKLYARYVA